MNRVIIILSLVVIAGYITPDLSQAHRHILALPEDERQSLKRSEGLSQRAEQPSWNRLSLTHTDTTYLPGSERHHPAAYRSSNAPDGAALMFSWPLASVPTFWMGPEGTSNEPILKQDDPR